MPFYKYYCEECKETYEVFHGFNETLTKCEKCLKPTFLKKVLDGITLNIKQSLGDINKEKEREIRIKEFIQESKTELDQYKKDILSK